VPARRRHPVEAKFAPEMCVQVPLESRKMGTARVEHAATTVVHRTVVVLLQMPVVIMLLRIVDTIPVVGMRVLIMSAGLRVVRALMAAERYVVVTNRVLVRPACDECSF
jgi:hypothetical protein